MEEENYEAANKLYLEIQFLKARHQHIASLQNNSCHLSCSVEGKPKNSFGHSRGIGIFTNDKELIDIILKKEREKTEAELAVLEEKFKTL